ncbi:MAG: hypothetical protein NT069_29530 [Planctomycetota bacterium]|nr:hypothetical protein [Planctomycetota bacterium]
MCRKTVGTELALRGVVRCLSTFDVLPVDHSALRAACEDPGADYEDNVTIRCAVAANIDVIATRDLTGFTQSPVAARLPAEILKGPV